MLYALLLLEEEKEKNSEKKIYSSFFDHLISLSLYLFDAAVTGAWFRGASLGFSKTPGVIDLKVIILREKSFNNSITS